jgi:hypothetical protein
MSTPTSAQSLPSQPTPVAHILANWPSASAPLPPHLPSSPSVFESLSTLSDLTPNAPGRAWNLLNTYFQARIREASYTVRHESIYATLQACDVDRAVESARRMSVGQGLEGSKRKYSIRDEISEQDAGKRRKCENEHELAGLTTPITFLPEPDARAPPLNLTLQIPRTPVLPDYRSLLEESKRATQEMSFCRREMQAAEENVLYARTRYMEAKGMAEKLQGEIRRVEREAGFSEE